MGIYPGASVIPRDDDVTLGIGIVIEIEEEARLGKCTVCWDETADVYIHNLGLNGQVSFSRRCRVF